MSIHKIGTPLRFELGTRVEVRVAPDIMTSHWLDFVGHPGGLIQLGTCDGGEWKAATILEQEYRQDEWCSDFVCAYSVLVDGEVTEDGMKISSPVREDDDRCIRLLCESGSAVIIDGLKSRADLNGKRGTVDKFVESMGRFAVKLTDSGEKVAVKRENLIHDVENTQVDAPGFHGLLKMPQKKLNPAKYYGIDPERLRM